MKSFSNFISEEDNDSAADDSVKGLQSIIVSHINRFASSDSKSNDRSLLLLNAALTMLATGSDPQSIAAAKRIVQLALRPKQKKEK